VPVELVEIKGLSKDETLAKMRDVEASVEEEARRSGKGTFVHAYCNGRAALWQKQLHVKYLGEQAFYPLEAKLKVLCGGQKLFVWAVFNSDRNLQVDPDLPEIDKTYDSVTVEQSKCCIVTHAVGLGEALADGRDFADQIRASL